MRSDRRPWAIVAALVVLLAAILVVVVVGRPSPDVVRSDDGRVSLSIDAGALPSGVSTADVRIRSVSVDRIPSAPGAAPIAGYELVPDGLQLRAPAQLTLALRLDAPPALLFGVHIAKDQWDLLDLEIPKWDADLGTLTISTSVSHFSSLFYYRDQFGVPGRISELDFDPIAITLSAPSGPVVVGSSFQVAATVRSSAAIGRAVASIEFRSRYAPLTLIAQRSWSFSGDFRAPRLFSPRFIDGVPRVETLNGTFTTLQTFTCVRPGYDVIIYGIEAGLDVTVQGEPASGKIRTWLVETRWVECVAGQGTQSPAPPTPSAEATPRLTPPTSPSPTGTSRVLVCGLPGGPTCPPSRP